MIQNILPNDDLVLFDMAMANHSGDEIRAYKEIGGRELTMSFYWPPAYMPVKKYPFLMLIHGGGWTDRKIFADQKVWNGDYLGYLARYYADKGFICASVDYRLMPEADLMGMVRDCTGAVEYVRNNAQSLGIDLARTAILGESAGGYLAAAVITMPSEARTFFKTAVLVNPITDLSDLKWREVFLQMPENPMLKRRSLPEQIDLLSPAMQVSQDTCPTLLLHGWEDGTVAPFHSMKFYDMMCQCGAEAELCLLQNTDHAFLLAEYMEELDRNPAPTNAGVDQIDKWLQTTVLA